MPIQIGRGPLGARSLTITFVGVTTDSDYPTSPSHSIGNISAVTGVDPDTVSIVDIPNNQTYPYQVNVLNDVHYSDWVGVDGESFANSGEVVSYIEGLKTEVEGYYSTPRLSVGSTTTLDIDVNVPFSHKIQFDNAINYFWNESDFHSTVAVSRYDKRVIAGVITTAASYQYNLEVQTIVGITSVPVTLNVV